MTHWCVIPSPLGPLTGVSDSNHLLSLSFGISAPADAMEVRDEVLDRTAEWISSYFRGEEPSADIPLAPKGTPFQKSVWALLTRIPYGQTVTYGELARALGRGRMSAQAVGQAVGKNPIPILLPCHRVLGVGDTLTGYAGGLERKRILLDLEEIKYR